MNDNDFERKLQSLTGALHRPDPTPAWKADILARARREAETTPIKRVLPPRWLMFGWAAAWAATLALNLTASGDAVIRPSQDVATSSAKPAPASAALPQDDLPTLLAFHQRKNLGFDLSP